MRSGRTLTGLSRRESARAGEEVVAVRVERNPLAGTDFKMFKLGHAQSPTGTGTHWQENGGWRP